MHRETKATAIPRKVKEAVFERDKELCILCGRPGSPCCHVVRRSAGGMGVEENIVTLCGRCHYAMDEGLYMKSMEALGFCSRREIMKFVHAYMRKHYPQWTPESVTYHKWGGDIGNAE